jgi:hypothetical protein
MNLLSLVGPWLDNICQIRRKWYYLSVSIFFFRSEQGPNLTCFSQSCSAPATYVRSHTVLVLSLLLVPHLLSRLIFWGATRQPSMIGAHGRGFGPIVHGIFFRHGDATRHLAPRAYAGHAADVGGRLHGWASILLYNIHTVNTPA